MIAVSSCLAGMKVRYNGTGADVLTDKPGSSKNPDGTSAICTLKALMRHSIGETDNPS